MYKGFDANILTNNISIVKSDLKIAMQMWKAFVSYQLSCKLSCLRIAVLRKKYRESLSNVLHLGLEPIGSFSGIINHDIFALE